MIKRIFFVAAAVMMAVSLSGKPATKFAKSLMKVPGVTSVTRMESSKFKERYIVTFRQFIDHRDTALGTFEQRIIVGNVHPDSITVFVTEGYACTYTERKDYREELSDIFNANSVIIEHRYFNQSIPAIKDEDHFWDYLTTFNAATDHHRIVQAFKTLYHRKCIATGVSKGGICANLFRAYYPKDVDVTVPYVAPLCEGVEDMRMAKEIPNYGPQDQREYLNHFMAELFRRKGEILPLFIDYVDSVNLKSRVRPEVLYDLTVLDLEIAVLARGEIKKLPDYATATVDELNKALVKYGAPEGFSPSYDNMPYYIQAAREIGHYGYDAERFKEYTDVDTRDYLRRCALPENAKCEYDPTTREMVLKFLNTTNAKMLFIYGEYDPWTAVGIKDLVQNGNIYVMINPGNCHRSKIRNFPDEQRDKILSVLRSWLYRK